MKYLTVKNIIFAYALFLIVIFIVPSSNFFEKEIFEISEFGKASFLILHGITSLLLALVWSFPFLIKKDYRRTILLSVGAIFLYFATVLFQTFGAGDNKIILFFNPIALSLFINLLIRKKYRLLPMGYTIGVCLSTLPLMGAIAPVLFFQLFFSEYPIKKQNKGEHILSRLIIYYLIMMGYYFIYGYQAGYNVLFFNILNKYIAIALIISYLLMIYFALYKILNSYYYSKSWKYFLSYIPILWIIPLISVLFEKRESNLITTTNN